MNYFHSGCIGDILYAIPSIRYHGPGMVYVANRAWTKPIQNRISAFKPLLECQGIGCQLHCNEFIDIDFSTFRRGGLLNGSTIVDRQARWSRAKIDLSDPWIMVEPDSRSTGRIVINMCGRWESFFFPWKQIVQTFGDDLLFIGLPDEHKSFCDQFGKVPYIKTDNLLQAAQLIKGSELFLGNQSSCNAIAEGLHHPKVLAVCQWACDCFFKRDGAIYCIDGSLSFEACGKFFHSEATRFIPKFNNDGLDRALLIAKCREVMVSKGITV